MDALAGGVEDFVWVGLGVDDQNRGVAVAAFEGAIAVLHREQSFGKSGRPTHCFSRAENYEGDGVLRQYSRNRQSV